MTALTGSRFNPVQKKFKGTGDPAFHPFTKVTTTSENDIGEVWHKVGCCKKIVAK